MKNKILITACALGALSISGCATNEELFAKYDKNCDLPKAKVIERVKVVEKEKIITKEVVKDFSMRWEPAVYFGFDKATLDKAEQQRLQRNVETLQKRPGTQVSVQAFTDVRGSASYNKTLAKKRLTMVTDYLKGKGINESRIRVAALGEGLPILDDSVAGRSVNRRVEMMLLNAEGRPMELKITPQLSKFKAPYPVR